MREWDLVGGSPADGEPASIRELARAVGRTADAAADSRMALQSIGSDVAGTIWSGNAATEFAAAFDPLAPDLGRMAESYQRVETALCRYAADLERIKREAREALNRARAADARRSVAEPKLDAARKRIAQLTHQLAEIDTDIRHKINQRDAVYQTQPEMVDYYTSSINNAYQVRGQINSALSQSRSDATRHDRDGAEARSDMKRERARIDRLRSDHQQAERRAAGAIEGAVDYQLRNKEWWQKLDEWTTSLAFRIRDVLADLDRLVGTLSTIVTVAAFFLPGLAPLAFALAVASATFSAAKLAMTITLSTSGAVDPATGRSLGRSDVNIDGLGAGLSLLRVGHAKKAKHAAQAMRHAGQFSRHASRVWIEGKRQTIAAQVTSMTGSGATSAEQGKAWVRFVAKSFLWSADMEDSYRSGRELVTDPRTRSALHVTVQSFPSPLTTQRKQVWRGLGVPAAGPCYRPTRVKEGGER